MKATILLFNFNEKLRLGQITRALLPLGLRLKKVNKEEYIQPLGYIAGVKDMNPTEQIYKGDELTNEMLLMVGMTNSMVDQLLLALKRAGVARINYKAVLTDANQHWNALQLFEELKREHESFHKPVL